MSSTINADHNACGSISNHHTGCYAVIQTLIIIPNIQGKLVLVEELHSGWGQRVIDRMKRQGATDEVSLCVVQYMHVSSHTMFNVYVHVQINI